MRSRNLRALKWTVIIVPLLVVALMLHYTLPRHEVVRIIGVTERLEALGWNRVFFAATPTGQGEGRSRDIRLIETMRTSESTLVFRNEDTGWVWPPYFKFDSADMQARGRDLVSDSDNPAWVAVGYYGIRSELLSIYPNVLRISPVDGPDVRLIPWTRIVFFVALIGGVFFVWRLLHRRRVAILGRSEDPRFG